MMDMLKYALIFVLAAACVLAALNSVRARRKRDPLERGRHQALTNVWMGVMLIVLSVLAMLMFSGSTVAVIVEAIFMVLGAFNIFAGLRSRSYYSRQQKANS
ncbi:hypothetical protein JJQ72_00575 [Paenibacillus sp. F411]|uniref:YtpI-like protein n=1 Tax=Paenibacillus algicola TaxID=2565926 RepID=A0A4P8XPJ8_9BACL|nr:MULTISPECIES: YtpI family protein [Paenibacillus]MBO2942483.1 hypothetical protein [Paenibacillus sp. F411]QCT03581.1 hypothetical protein E6C60_2870 [Paenibacillus algicola]